MSKSPELGVERVTNFNRSDLLGREEKMDPWSYKLPSIHQILPEFLPFEPLEPHNIAALKGTKGWFWNTYNIRIPFDSPPIIMGIKRSH